MKWYDCGTDNPFRYEGKKTYAYEIAQALGWRTPDRILHPAAGGMSLAKTWKGFNDLKRLGWVDGLPKMTLVQGAGCADGARVGDRRADNRRGREAGDHRERARGGRSRPARRRALEAVRNSGGAAAAVTDDEIRAAMRDLAGEGLFIEPSGAVTLAAPRRLVAAGHVDRGESVVCVLTGSGVQGLRAHRGDGRDPGRGADRLRRDARRRAAGGIGRSGAAESRPARPCTSSILT